MTTVTTDSGRTVKLQTKNDSVIASSGPVEFAAEKTDGGFKSVFIVPEAGNKRVEVVLSGVELKKAHKVFDDLSSAVSKMLEQDRLYDERKNKVYNAMNK